MVNLPMLAASRSHTRSMMLALLALWLSSPPGFATRFVAESGSDVANDCTDSGSPCATVQWAVDQATAGEEVKVAEGLYTGTQVVTVDRMGTDYDYKQVVFIDKALTVRGGYHESDWTTSDPNNQITEINAEGDGRVVTIVDTLDGLVVLDGLMLREGDMTGLGNPPGLGYHVCRGDPEEDCGGGVFVYRSAFQLLNSEVSDNVASTVEGDGGGVYLWQARTSTIENTRVESNSAVFGGGGLYVTEQSFPLTVRGSRFYMNTGNRGGAVDLATNINALVRLEDCALIENKALLYEGGALYARLTNNGLMLELERVIIDDNKAWEQGKGVYLDAAGAVTPEARLVNVVFSSNNEIDGAPMANEDAVLAIAPRFTSLKATLAHVTAIADPMEPHPT